MTNEEIALQAAEKIKRAPILHASDEEQAQIISRIILTAIERAIKERVRGVFACWMRNTNLGG